MIPLSRIGFKRNWIYEVVVSARGHAAPMGVWTPDFRRIKLKAYKTSQTGRLIKKSGQFAVHFPSGVDSFQRALKSKKIAGGCSRLSCRVVDVKEDSRSFVFTAKVFDCKIKKPVFLFNRASSLALECLIESTKPKPRRKLIREYHETIKKVAPGSVYKRVSSSVL